jgi:hypothetical protein
VAAIDPTLRDPTPTGAVADRADAYRIAVGLIRQAGMADAMQPDDALYLAKFLTGE